MTSEGNSANLCRREPGPSQGAESWRTWTTWCRHESLLSFITSDVFEPRTSTGSGLFVHLSCDFEQTFGPIISIRVKTVSHTNLVASRHIKGEKAHFRLMCFAQKGCCLSSILLHIREIYLSVINMRFFVKLGYDDFGGKSFSLQVEKHGRDLGKRPSPSSQCKAQWQISPPCLSLREISFTIIWEHEQEGTK